MTDTEIVERMFGRRTYDVLIEIFGVPPDEAVRLLPVLGDRRDEVKTGAPLREIAGAASFVRKALAAGIPCAVASSASSSNIGLALEAIGLGELLEVIVDASAVELGKPSPDPYLAAARGLGVDPRRCVVFEDTPVGIEAGLAAGARCVGVATLGRPDLLGRAHLVLEDFRGRTPQGILDDLATRGPIPDPPAMPGPLKGR